MLLFFFATKSLDVKNTMTMRTALGQPLWASKKMKMKKIPWVICVGSTRYGSKKNGNVPYKKKEKKKRKKKRKNDTLKKQQRFIPNSFDA